MDCLEAVLPKREVKIPNDGNIDVFNKHVKTGK